MGQIFPVPDTKSEPVIKLLAQELFVRYGVPFEILTDNAKCFTSKEFTKFCEDLGIKLKHSTPHNPKANFAERANQSLKRKLNSFLRQEEQKINKFTCDICKITFNSVEALHEHLNAHPDSDLEEASSSPKHIVQNLLAQEYKLRNSGKSYNWLQAIPAVLWSMRTAFSATRGASPFELMFGKKPTSSLDLLFNQKVREPNNPKNISEYLMARTRRNELAQVFAKENLRSNIERKRQFYVDIERTFHPGDLVSLFTPVYNPEASEKLDSFWTGPWKILSRIAPTTYTVENVVADQNKPQKTHIVQVDRLKKYFEEDQPVTPPLSFDPNPIKENFDKDQFPFKPKKHVVKAMKSKDVIENEDLDHKSAHDLKVIPPWESHLDPCIPLPDEDETSVPKPKKPRVQREKMTKKYAGLPAPMTTRSKAKTNDISISSLDYCELLNLQQPSDQREFDIDIYDQFFEQR